ncbi:MAG: glycosyltransferase family 39 protein [Oligoflexia bacterium]|nr:glycosyltransferase family 39 protein [Oligoflexia bacterium]
MNSAPSVKQKIDYLNRFFSSKKPVVLCYLIILLNYLRNAYHHFGGDLYSDIRGYIIYANNLTFPGIYNTGIREPLWIWLVKLHLMVFHNHELSMRVLGFLLLMVTAYLMHRFVKDLTNSPFFAFVALFFISCNNYISDTAVICTRDVLLTATMPAVAYLTFINNSKLTPVKRLLLWGVACCVVLGTKLSFFAPTVIAIFWSCYKFKIPLWKGFLPVLSGLLFISPYLLYCKKISGDYFYANNLQIPITRGYECGVIDQNKCKYKCERYFRLNDYVKYPDSKTTSFDYIFRLRSMSELITSLTTGYVTMFLLPTDFSYRQIGGIRGPFNPFFFVYIGGLIFCLIGKYRSIVLLPILYLNVMPFAVDVMDRLDWRLYSQAAPFIGIIVGLGYYSYFKKKQV